RLALAIFIACTCAARAYVLESLIWSDPSPALYLNLNATESRLGALAPSFTLIDGSQSFDQVVAGAVSTWNQYLTHLQIRVIEGSNANGTDSSDGLNETAF